jgi:response regulator RpfG family c-di-GMP phosphodiesterase
MPSLMEKQNRQRILIVDDETSILNMLTTLFSERYQCDTATSAERALALMNEHEYAVVLTDVSMPSISGLQLLSEIRIAHPEINVIVISGVVNLEQAVESLRRGAFDYLTKPFSMEQLELAVERAITQQLQTLINRQHTREMEEQLETRTMQLREMNRMVNEMFEELYLSYRVTLRSLAIALETRNIEPHGHIQRVTAYCLRLGKQFELSDDELVALEHGALLHDIGQIALPDHLLRKTDLLNSDDWKIMQRHIDYGAQIISGIKFMQDARLVVLQHHEKWDGAGYPLGIRGQEIALNARIFAVADAVDSITSDRPHRAAQNFEVAEQELLKCAGTHFDPAVVEAWFAVPRSEWQDIRSQAMLRGGLLDDSHRRSIRSRIMVHKTGKLQAPEPVGG